MGKAVRGVLAVAAFIVLVGGYYVHQWMLLNGRLEEWTARISGPNLVLGWFFLASGVVLALGKVKE